MDKIKCITFDKNAQDSLPQHIKDKMKADRDNAERKWICKCGGRFEYKNREGYVCSKCGWTKLFL
jgi:hypothetical protein